MKYLNRYACSIILTMTEAAEIIKGTRPTAKTSLGETGVKINMITNGTILAGIASSRQFNDNH
jgi:ribosomal protein S3